MTPPNAGEIRLTPIQEFIIQTLFEGGVIRRGYSSAHNPNVWIRPRTAERFPSRSINTLRKNGLVKEVFGGRDQADLHLTEAGRELAQARFGKME